MKPSAQSCFLLATVVTCFGACKPDLSVLTQGQSGGLSEAGNASQAGSASQGGDSPTAQGGRSSSASAKGGASEPQSSGGATSGSTAGSAGGTTNAGGTTSAGGTAGLGGTAGSSSTAVTCVKPTVDPGDPPNLKYDFDTAGADGSHQGVPGWTASGRIGGALSFTGESQYVELPDNVLRAYNEVTIAAWVKLTVNPVGATLFDIGTSADNHFYLTTNAGSNTIGFGAIVNGGAAQTTLTTYAMPTGVWKHLAVVVGSGKISLYIDGQSVVSKSISFSPSALGDTAHAGSFIGHSLTSTAQTYGQIDDFRIYGRALSREQLELLSPPGTDYVHFRFDETCGTKAYDRSDAKLEAELPAGGTWTPSGHVASALTLDGVSQYVKLPANFLKGCGSDLTIALWLQRQSTNSFERVFSFGQSVTTVMSLTPAAPGGLMQFSAKLNGGEARGSSDEQLLQALSSTLSPQRGIWGHVGVVLKGGRGSLYYNGAQVTSATDSITIKPSDMGATTINELGRSLYLSEPFLNGTIDDFRMSCRAYSVAEMRILALVDRN